MPGMSDELGYAGNVAPSEAFAALNDVAESMLIDVRTQAEWAYVGLPDLSGLGKQVLTLEWQRFPGGERNEQFVQDLEVAGVPRDAPVYFLCRSGVRSVAAARAATAAGYGSSYNITEGFEGPHDRHGHRSVSGWKVAGLPWRQG